MSAFDDLAEKIKTDLLAMASDHEGAIREAFVELANDTSNVIAAVAPVDPDQAARDLRLLADEALQVGLLHAKQASRELTAKIVEYVALGIKLLVAA